MFRITNSFPHPPLLIPLSQYFVFRFWIKFDKCLNIYPRQSCTHIASSWSKCHTDCRIASGGIVRLAIKSSAWLFVCVLFSRGYVMNPNGFMSLFTHILLGCFTHTMKISFCWATVRWNAKEELLKIIGGNDQYQNTTNYDKGRSMYIFLIFLRMHCTSEEQAVRVW